MFKQTLFFLLLVLLASCDGLVTHQVILDNPHLADLTVTIGEQEYNVAGYTDKAIELNHGEHKVKAVDENDEVVFEDVVEVTGNGILNPTLSTYVAWKDLYLENIDNYDIYAESALDMESSVMVDEKEYNDVDFTVYENQAFIEEDWDYGVNEAWPDEVDLYSGSYVTKSKLYRVSQLEEDWGYWGDIDFSDYADDDINALLDSLEVELNEEIEVPLEE